MLIEFLLSPIKWVHFFTGPQLRLSLLVQLPYITRLPIRGSHPSSGSLPLLVSQHIYLKVWRPKFLRPQCRPPRGKTTRKSTVTNSTFQFLRMERRCNRNPSKDRLIYRESTTRHTNKFRMTSLRLRMLTQINKKKHQLIFLIKSRMNHNLEKTKMNLLAIKMCLRVIIMQSELIFSKSEINLISLSNYIYNYFENREVILYNISQQTKTSLSPLLSTVKCIFSAKL